MLSLTLGRRVMQKMQEESKVKVLKNGFGFVRNSGAKKGFLVLPFDVGIEEICENN